jgi:major type 1 subunit fimbrin (pilin)
MNRKLPIALALSLVFGLAANAAMASNTITVNGELVAKTCTVVGGQGAGVKGNSADFAVTLPTLNNSEFKTAGSTGGDTHFTLTLADCEADQVVSAHFAPLLKNVDLATGTLMNTQAGGSTIQVQFLDHQNADAAIKLADGTDLGTATAGPDGSADLIYTARYYAALANATAGKYVSTMEYSITYP